MSHTWDLVPQSEGAALIEQERRRQVIDEGWDDAHDDDKAPGVLAAAGVGYANSARLKFRRLPSGEDLSMVIPVDWPWEEEWWKPSDDPVRNLVKAGALLAAEIDRALRARRQESDGVEDQDLGG